MELTNKQKAIILMSIAQTMIDYDIPMARAMGPVYDQHRITIAESEGFGPGVITAITTTQMPDLW